MNGEKEKKEQIRKRIKELLNESPISALEEKSKLIQRHLFSVAEYKNSSLVMFYVSMEREVATLDAIKTALAENKKVAVPFVLKSQNIMFPCRLNSLKNLKPGPFGILQPVKEKIQNVPVSSSIPCTQELGLIDLIILPGMAFDRKGNRVGRGKGFYDRFLKSINPQTAKIGLAFSCQIVEEVSINDSDIPVDKIVTEEGVIECRG